MGFMGGYRVDGAYRDYSYYSFTTIAIPPGPTPTE